MIRQMKYNGATGVYCEKFIIGREFTALVVGDLHDHLTVYPVVEREFNPKIPLELRFLTFEKYWAIPNGDSKPLSEYLDPGEYFYRYGIAEDELQPRLQKVARNAYSALGGTGYARVDMRAEVVDEETKIYVLEVNAPCGVSTDEQTSVSWIFNLGGKKISDFLSEIMHNAILKVERPAKK